MNKTIFALFLSTVGLIAQPIVPGTTPWSRAFLKQTNGTPISPSQYGATFSSNPWTGGGTDDSSAIQAALDQATNGPIEVLIPKGALISTNLVIRSNTKLRFLPGAGLFMAPHSDCWVLGNQQNTNYSTTNIVIEGGILNANGNSQSEYVTNGYRLSGAPGVWGVWFAGVDGIAIRDTKIVSAKAYTYLFSDSRNILMENCSALYTNNTISTNTLYGNDGVHLMCYIQDFICRNFRYTSGSDDGFAIMTDETDSTLQVQDPRWTTNSGSMSNILFDGFYIENGKNVGKFQNYGSTNAWAYNVTLRNIHGQASTQGLLEFDVGSNFKANNLVIDGYDLEMGGSADSFSYPMLSLGGIQTSFLWLNKIRILDRSGGGIGTRGIIELSVNQTNIVVNNAYIEGSVNSAGANDCAIGVVSGGGNTNQPLVIIQNLTALKMYSVIDSVGGSGVTTPQGVIKLLGVQYTPTSILNGSGFTNFGPYGNLPVSTNWVSGKLYTNLTGSSQMVQSPVVCTISTVAGGARVDLKTGTGTTLNATIDSYGFQSVVGTLGTTNAGKVSGVIQSGQTFSFTNAVGGAGDSAANLPGGQQITY